MNIIKTDFRDLLIIEHDAFLDDRGIFKEVSRKDILEKKLGYKINFCQDNSVISYQKVLRGLHYQEKPNEQSKLVTVVHGEILDIAVDIRKNSKTYGKYFSCVLSSKSGHLYTADWRGGVGVTFPNGESFLLKHNRGYRNALNIY